MQLLRQLRHARRAARIVLFVFVAVQPAVLAAPDSAYREILETAYAADEPGATVIVARGDEVLYLDARGMADLENGIPIEPNMVLRLGSITKQFTAAAILMLAEQGKLSLDDPLTKFLPDYPEVGQAVTVEHLLTHTSGIVSYTGIPNYMETEIARELTVDELVAVFRDLPVEFAPGEQFAYNNSGYVLLGAIIEKVSGMSYEEFIQQKIFDPVGMTRSYYGSHSRIIPGRVSGYDGESGEYENAHYLSMTQPYAAGSLLSTVGDMLRWNTALFGGKVVSQASLEKMIAPYELNDGESTGYAYGIGVREVRGKHTIAHGGGIFGFSTDALYIPEEKIFVAVLSNNAGSASDPEMTSTRLAAVALGEPYPVWKEVPVEPALLKRYTGVYRIDDEGERVVTFEDGKLYTQRSGGAKLQAHPASETKLFYEGSLSWFEMQRGEDDNWRMMMHQQGAGQAEESLRIGDAPDPRAGISVAPEILASYAGEYELGRGFSVTIRHEGARLFAQATGQREVEIFAESETDFFYKVVDAQITFVPGKDGGAPGLVLHQGGRDLPGKRKD
jgi:CubicO group peptidase (beta-lactamase class C family)